MEDKYSLKSDQESIAAREAAKAKEEAKARRNSLLRTLLLVIAAVIIYIFLSRVLNDIPAKMSVERFMYYHSVEEIVEYWQRYDEPSHVASVFNEEWSDYYFVSEDEVFEAINKAYAYGYYAGATDTSGKLDSAVANKDLDAIYDWLAGAYHPSDFFD